MVKRIISAVAAICMVLGSASLLPQGTFVDSISITSSAAKILENADVVIEHSAGSGCWVTNFKNTTATSYVLQYSIKINGGYYSPSVIKEDAFRGWKHNLSSIEVESGYEEIEKNAFLDSWKLRTYIIPKKRGNDR